MQLRPVTKELKSFVVATERTPGAGSEAGNKALALGKRGFDNGVRVSEPAERGWLFKGGFECDCKEGISDFGVWISLSLH